MAATRINSIYAHWTWGLPVDALTNTEETYPYRSPRLAIPERNMHDRKRELLELLATGSVPAEQLENVRGVISDIDAGKVGDYYVDGKAVDGLGELFLSRRDGGPGKAVWKEIQLVKVTEEVSRVVRPKWTAIVIHDDESA
ncbi:hypothetical protein TWF481_009712 [Arthrobotrys musiformis]|uniref:Uncharacterized protein n=1 Tax=Arthrobotrys musiformis TaxID=47236 RepID=A0AAV9W5R1_9PEZI